MSRHSPSTLTARGLILLALVGAWLWLPRLRRRDLAAAGFALALAAAAALPVSAALERHEAWIDYSGWRIAAGTGRRSPW